MPEVAFAAIVKISSSSTASSIMLTDSLADGSDISIAKARLWIGNRVGP